MSRSTVSCQEKHTPQSPVKNRIRRDWMLTIPRYKDIITISHGALETLMILGHKGWLYVCDVDPGVIESTHYAAKTEYRGQLRIVPRLWTVQDTVLEYCEDEGKHASNLGAVDIDLAFCVDQCEPILMSVLRTLLIYNVRTKVLLTFRNGRDNLVSLENREE